MAGKAFGVVFALGFAGFFQPSAAAAAFPVGDYTYTQPAAQLILPFDTTADRATFVLVSNIGSDRTQISTRWTFWSESCERLADYPICLTIHDTIVVDPRNTGAVGPANQSIGAPLSIIGETGILTVTAYETNNGCDSWEQTGAAIADGHLVGTFTITDLDSGASFANDALGLGTDETGNIVLPHQHAFGALDFDILTFAPEAVDNSMVFLSVLKSGTGPAQPTAEPVRFALTWFDTSEIPRALPDQIISCATATTIRGGLIPESLPLSTSGIIRMQPAVGAGTSPRFLYGISGSSVGSFGQTSRMKLTERHLP